MKNVKSNNCRKGFSLVEVLLVVALIGIVSSIAIPHINAREVYQTVRDQRNAQELSSFSVATQSAGLNLVVPGNMDATLANVLQGGAPTTGSFKGHKFTGPKLGWQDARAASRYLTIQSGTLIYNPHPAN